MCVVGMGADRRGQAFFHVSIMYGERVAKWDFPHSFCLIFRA